MIGEQVERAGAALSAGMTACTCIPGAGRQPPHSGLYRSTSICTLPGGIDHQHRSHAEADERFADPQFAVSDAFRRARRRLQDRAKVMRHEVKTLHERIDRTLDQPDES